jgi:hypothetical protein
MQIDHETLRTGQRAFVFADLIQVIPAIDAANRSTKIAVFIVRLSNGGNTATKDLKFIVACRRSNDNLHEPWALLYQEPVDHMPSVIGPKAATTTNCSLALDDLAQIQDGKLFGYIMTDITYRDRIDETILHRTEVAWKFSSVDIRAKKVDKDDKGGAGDDSATPDIFVTLTNVGAHNCSDEECPKE